MDLATLIASICTSFTVNQTACISSFDAMAKQTGVQSSVQSLEDYSLNQGQRYFHTYVTPVTGEQVWAIGGGAYRIYRDKHIGYGFKVKHVIDTVQIDANPIGGSVNIGWRF